MKTIFFYLKLSLFLKALFIHNLALSYNNPNINCNNSDHFCTSNFIELIQQTNSIEDMIFNLPLHVKRNLTFKRGNNISKRNVGILGPHGHLVSSSDSSSASPEEPRAFVWDEKTGFTATWNSGSTVFSAHDRVDIYDFNFETNTHDLKVWIPSMGNELKNANFTDQQGRQCTTCHGSVKRPIFPMYPDWPQFYGEFNDEMTSYPNGWNAIRSDLRIMANEFQPIEKNLFDQFIKGQGRTNPRYKPLFDSKAPNNRSNIVYPYRPDTSAGSGRWANISRAFYHRPNLRLGVLYNRLTALQTFEKIKKSPVFQKFPDVVFYSLLDCGWNFGNESQRVALRNDVLLPFLNFINSIKEFENIDLRGTRFLTDELLSSERSDFFREVINGRAVYFSQPPIQHPDYNQIPYEDLLKILNLDIKDLDIRFAHNSNFEVVKTGLRNTSYTYNIYDPKAFYFTKSAMDLGYIKETYALNPICNNNNSRCRFSFDGTYMQGMRYFNSYFDGSATTNELLAAQMLLYLTNNNEDFSKSNDLQTVRNLLRQNTPDPNLFFETLMKKYRNFTNRLQVDNDFFNKMDEIGPWIQLPYPEDLINVHNRESFWRREPQQRHAQWTSYQNKLNSTHDRSGEKICWNVYNVMFNRFRK